jgi:hypothetical protein
VHIFSLSRGVGRERGREGGNSSIFSFVLVCLNRCTSVSFMDFVVFEMILCSQFISSQIIIML